MIQDQLENMIRELSGKSTSAKQKLIALSGSRNLQDPRMRTVYPLIYRYLYDEQVGSAIPSKAEIAVFNCLKYYAKAILKGGQQTNGVSFFRALGKNRNLETDDHLNSLLKATNCQYIFQEIERLFMLSNVKNVDYAELSKDLYFMQFNYERTRQTQNKWASEYYRK